MAALAERLTKFSVGDTVLSSGQAWKVASLEKGQPETLEDGRTRRGMCGGPGVYYAPSKQGLELCAVLAQWDTKISETNGVKGHEFYSWKCWEWEKVMSGQQTLDVLIRKCSDILAAINQPPESWHGLRIRRRL